MEVVQAVVETVAVAMVEEERVAVATGTAAKAGHAALAGERVVQ